MNTYEDTYWAAETEAPAELDTDASDIEAITFFRNRDSKPAMPNEP